MALCVHFQVFKHKEFFYSSFRSTFYIKTLKAGIFKVNVRANWQPVCFCFGLRSEVKLLQSKDAEPEVREANN